MQTMMLLWGRNTCLCLFWLPPLLLVHACPAAYVAGSKSVPLLYTLRHTMIRHVKAQTIQGQSVLALPDKTEELVPGGSLFLCHD
jgi:hypothetical protein